MKHGIDILELTIAVTSKKKSEYITNNCTNHRKSIRLKSFNQLFLIVIMYKKKKNLNITIINELSNLIILLLADGELKKNVCIPGIHTVFGIYCNMIVLFQVDIIALTEFYQQKVKNDT